VEAVDELEPQRDQQRQPEQDEDAKSKRLIDRIDVVEQALEAIARAHQQDANENPRRPGIGLFVQPGRAPAFIGFCARIDGDIGHWSPRHKRSREAARPKQNLPGRSDAVDATL
jgi:hypothetical protein